MEQRDASSISPPSPPQPQLPPHHRRDTLPARLNNPSASASAPAPTTANVASPSTTPPPPQTTLSTSEPTLRFPRPQGNRRLANWISSSNPDIMRLATTTEDTGLSESTYELISGPNTDTESQDDNYTESISESVGSLDFHRPDDVHSLAGTEQTYDDESIVDEVEIVRPATPEHEVVEEDEEDDDEAQENTAMTESQATNEPGVESLSESEHEARSRSSLEYTHQSLGTPSFPTPEASRIVERDELPDFSSLETHESKKSKKRPLVELDRPFSDWISELFWGAAPGLVFILALSLTVPYFSDLIFPNSTTPSGLSTTNVTPSPTSYSTTSTAVTSSSSRPSPSSSKSVGLIPVGEAPADDWIFGAKQPVVSFTAEANNGILIHIPKSIKKTWLAKDCLTVTAKRDDIGVDHTVSPVEEGILLQLSKKEVYGVISISFEAKCRPKIHKMVKVHFGKGIMEVALERTKHLAQDISGLVPAAAQEAERRIEEAKRSLGSVCQNVCQNLQSASETVSKTFGASFSDTRLNLENFASSARAQLQVATKDIVSKIDTLTQQAATCMSSVQDVQNQLQLHLLDAQVSAKIWWLQATGRKEQRDEYQRKAKSYVAKKYAAAKEMLRARHPEKKSEKPSKGAWFDFVGKGRCQRKAHKGKHTHQCKAAA